MLIIAPMLAFMALQLLLLPAFARDRPLTRRIVLILSVLAFVRYAWWRVSDTLPEPRWEPSSVLALAFCALELLVGVFALRLEAGFIRPIRRSKEADEHAEHFGSAPPRVVTLIPTYNESADVLRRTIVGASSLDYPNFGVWVLDDGRRDWLRDMCLELNVGYLRRPNNRGYKSGNLNYAIEVLRKRDAAEFAAVFDSDFVPKQAFLKRLLPLMRDADVAMAQSTQFFFNADPFQYAFGARRAWPDDTREYFENYLPCADGAGVAQCCGTSFVVRCSAIRAIGGFATESVSDDTLTGIKLGLAGYRIVHLDECLSTGLAPEGLDEYLSQRRRWTLGNLQISLSRWGEAAQRKGISKWFAIAWAFRPPLEHLMAWLWVLLPLPALYAGVFWIDASTDDILSYFGPVLAARFGRLWVHRAAVLPILSDANKLVSSSAVIQAVRQAVFNPTNRVFEVTSKGKTRQRINVHLPQLWPLAVALAAMLGGIVYAASTAATPSVFDGRGWLAWLAVYEAMVLYVACVVCIEPPRYRAAERFPARVASTLVAGEARVASCVLDISEQGCLVSSAASLEPGAACQVAIEGIGAVSGVVARRAGRNLLGLRLDPNPSQFSELVRQIYCTVSQPGPARHWGVIGALRPLLRSLAGL